MATNKGDVQQDVQVRPTEGRGVQTGPASQVAFVPTIPQALVFALAFALTFACGLAFALILPNVACAEDIDTDPTPDALQLEVERTASAYDEATERSEQATAALDENTARIAQLEEQIPIQQERSDRAARELYKIQQQSVGILELLLSAGDFNGMLQQLDYINHVTDANMAEITRLNDMHKELTQAQESLERLKIDADSQVEIAASALAAAQEARLEAQRKAEEEARQRAEAAAAASAAQKAKPQDGAAPNENGEGEGGQPAEEQPTTDPNAAAATTEASNDAAASVSDGADWSSDKAAFVNGWAARIDAYLAGSPLAGHGRNFAEAAWNYGVDPRWSPAISFTESGRGANCFRPHNAWGWGSVSWGSWEEAIDDHVRGLARGYGYTISMDAARKYCPPNAQHWYERTLGEMNKI